MKVIESFIMSKTGVLEQCEDKIFISNDFLAVIDGATSKSSFRWNGKTSGAIAGEIIGDTLKQSECDITLDLLIFRINNAIKDIYEESKGINYFINNPVDRITACMIIYSKFHNQIWIIGDCKCSINSVQYENVKKVDTILAEARALFIELQLLRGKSIEELIAEDLGRGFIMNLLKEQYILQNNSLSQYSYGVIDGFEINSESIKIIDGIEKSSMIILASDGYFSLKEDLFQTEQHLKAVLAEDPLLIGKYKSTKGLVKGNVSFDDRALIRFIT
ncbi:hypothetical protein NBE98_05900 [Clostridium swellfunianum]|uniref:hypothetical protein n=1 Tax=Clostridium swellfunianum TaxID=1367462 RepID=UPI00202EB1D3|nr:hypothetical protein [Clostridium swellfunianum]MCM0647904.1 hypothetical protein [Clostridium swellfunianum]